MPQALVNQQTCKGYDTEVTETKGWKQCMKKRTFCKVDLTNLYWKIGFVAYTSVLIIVVYCCL